MINIQVCSARGDIPVIPFERQSVHFMEVLLLTGHLVLPSINQYHLL